MLKGGYIAVAAVTMAATALATACGRDSGLDYRPTATAEEIMRTLIDPSADAIWDAVVTDATEGGSSRSAPKRRMTWRRSATTRS